MKQNRENYKKQMMEVKEKFEQSPMDESIALEYAEKLFQLGSFLEAKEILKLLLSSPQATYFYAQIEYLNGNYSEAEKLYEALTQFPEFKKNAEHGLELVYYQTDQYSKIQNLPDSPSVIGDIMRAFGSLKPYQIEWNETDKVMIPFLVTDPLPLIQVEIRGHMYNFLIDTGAGDTIIDTALAASLGIEVLAKHEGVGAGDVTATASYGILDSIMFNDVKITSVPVYMMPTEPFTAALGNEFTVSGVIGVGIFKRFLTTMDYPAGQLILCKKNRHSIIENQSYANAVEVPFVLASSHLIISTGEANGKEVNVFVDSGLAVPGVSILLSNDTVHYADVSVSEPETIETVGAAGVIEIQISQFSLDTFKLGDLPESKKMDGLLGVFPESMYFNENGGFFIDALISHGFLKDYRWIIDFDSMKMIFI